MATLLDLLTEVRDVSARLPMSSGAFSSLEDAELLRSQQLLAEIGRNVSASSAVNAGEIAWRSRPDLGYAGLAQRTGARTPESLVQQLTGSTGREASTLVRVGKVMAEAETTPVVPTVGPGGMAGDSAGGAGGAGSDDAGGEAGSAGVVVPVWDGSGTPWLAPVGRAVAAGVLPVSAADAIRSGLGTPSDTVTVSQLTDAAVSLVGEASRLDADRLLKRARLVRDQIDAAGVAERERARHEARFLKVFRRYDGMIRIDGLLAPESGGAEVLATFEAVTAPRRGGPRFVDEEEQERARRLLEDPRTLEQIHADALVHLLKLGVDVDPQKMVGTRTPSVRVLVTNDDIAKAKAAETADAADAGAAGTGTGTGSGNGVGSGPGSRVGIGWLEGHPDAVSIGTVQLTMCGSGTIPIHFDDDGQCVNVGREHRLFTTKQRIALAARDGGCRFPGCDRPPSWCEAHHLVAWSKHGCTDLADGILLCRHHHMLLHNNHWQIQRTGADYYLIPPKERDPNQTPIPLPPKSNALTHLQRQRAG